jgi:hypothetical protein
VTDTQPPLESTGTGPTLPPTNGVTLDVAGLPIGDGSVVATSSDGASNCLTIAWTGHLPSWAVLTVTQVTIGGPFNSVDTAAAGCGGASSQQPACIGDQLTAADNGGTSCLVGVEWDRSSTDGTVKLLGDLHCVTVDSSQCEQLRDGLVNGSKPIQFSFTPPSTQPTDTTAPEDTSISTTQPPTSISS